MINKNVLFLVSTSKGCDLFVFQINKIKKTDDIS